MKKEKQKDTRSKRFKGEKAKVDPKKVYLLDEALTLVLDTAKVKFDASVEVHVRVGIDPSKGEQQIRSTVVLPHGTGKTKKIAAFVSGNHEKDAQAAGADFVYGEEDIARIKQTEKIEFEVAVATPDMMPKLASIAKILGPKGLMPNPKTETVGLNVKAIIEALKKGKVTFKNDDTSNVHVAIGKVSFGLEKIKENYLALMEALRKAKPPTSKGVYIKAITLASSMGPGVKVELS